MTPTQQELLNKIWNPDLPLVLIDPPLEPKDIEGISRMFVFNNAKIISPNLIKHADSTLIKSGGGCVTRWAADLDRYLSRSVYGSASYASTKKTIPVYYLGFRYYSPPDSSFTRYWIQEVDSIELAEYIQLTANLIKQGY